MAQTDVEMSELGDRPREFKLTADIDLPFDGEIIMYDLRAEWEFEIINQQARLNAGQLEATVLINGVAVPSLSDFDVEVGGTRIDTPTGPVLVEKGQQVRVELLVTTGFVTPEKLTHHLYCRATKDLTV